MSVFEIVDGIEREPAVEVNDEFGELLGRECGAEVVKRVVVSDDEGSSWGPLDLNL